MLLETITSGKHTLKELCYDSSFAYQFLSRLESDCKYFLGGGGRDAKHLWTEDPQKQIDLMIEIYNLLKTTAEEPEWITVEKIEEYRKEMVLS